ncbi:hypothetical protein GUJ93_ZPchr0006g43757 [Zizania palustris]|uniref:Uncharacterized protein n=1 Tax=Zizania palustris TaxID=103762 RepID=A0A8J5VI74_ZIZPA|nr:hypothetical protein GUJ93_ZPchr0006g43757 [Zizania palustris]
MVRWAGKQRSRTPGRAIASAELDGKCMERYQCGGAGRGPDVDELHNSINNHHPLERRQVITTVVRDRRRRRNGDERFEG